MKRKDSKLEHLSRVPLFSALNQAELRTVGRLSDVVHYPEGKVICEEGSTGREFFLVIDGKAAVKKGKRTVATVGPGSYFGELSILDGAPRSATVVASSDMNLLVLEQREFGGVIRELPALAAKLLSAMAARLREADKKAFSH